MNQLSSRDSQCKYQKYCQMVQERQMEGFFHKYGYFKKKMKEYIQASKLDDNLYELSLRFHIHQVEHEIKLVLNINKRLPVRENARFRMKASSKLFRYIKYMVRLQHNCLSSSSRDLIRDNQEELQKLSLLVQQFESSHPEQHLIF